MSICTQAWFARLLITFHYAKKSTYLKHHYELVTDRPKLRYTCGVVEINPRKYGAGVATV